jgi:hypothetical protein
LNTSCRRSGGIPGPSSSTSIRIPCGYDPLGGQDHPPVAPAGLGRVQHEIDQDLLEPFGIDGDRGQIFVSPNLGCQPTVVGQALELLRQSPEQIGNAGGDKVQVEGPAKVEGGLHQFLDAQQPLDELLDAGSRPRP